MALEWEERVLRHERFWEEREKGEGAYFSIISPNGSVVTPPRAPESHYEQWASPEYALANMEYELKSSQYLLDAIPSRFVNFGAGVLSALMGGDYLFTEHTVWFDSKPILRSIDEIHNLSIDPKHKLYKAIMDMTDLLAENAKGRFMVSTTDLGGNLDVIAALRDSQELMMDFVENEEAVVKAIEFTDQCWLTVWQEQLRHLLRYTDLQTSWIPLATKKSWYPLQCDMSAMFSPSMFERFVSPSLERVAAQMDTALYHLDGPGEIVHLPLLLAVPKIHAIQWVPLPNMPYCGRYIQNFVDAQSLEVYRQVQAANRKLVLMGIVPEQVEKLFDAISPDGVFLFMEFEEKQQAEEFADYARRRWMHK